MFFKCLHIMLQMNKFIFIITYIYLILCCNYGEWSRKSFVEPAEHSALPDRSIRTATTQPDGGCLVNYHLYFTLKLYAQYWYGKTRLMSLDLRYWTWKTPWWTKPQYRRQTALGGCLRASKQVTTARNLLSIINILHSFAFVENKVTRTQLILFIYLLRHNSSLQNT